MQILSGMPSHSDGARFGDMVVLAMAATCPHQKPSIVFNKANGFPDFHGSKFHAAFATVLLCGA